MSKKSNIEIRVNSFGNVEIYDRLTKTYFVKLGDQWFSAIPELGIRTQPVKSESLTEALEDLLAE